MHTDATVFVVDDDQALRESLQYLVESIGYAVKTFETAEAFLQAYDPDEGGCLVLDVRVPGMGGLELQEQLLQRQCTLPVIIITGFAEVPTAVRAMKAGAMEFIEKPFSHQHLLDRVRDAIVMDGEMRQRARERAELIARGDRLTPRELQVMERVIDGKSNKVIAAELELSPKTIEVHRARIMTKMQAKSLAELVRVGLALRDRNGALPPGSPADPYER